MAADPGSDEVSLLDGTALLVRPILPADASGLVALHERLSADTIYRRYFGARPHLLPTDVHRFTNVDGRARFALVAMRGGDLVAVARYEGRPGDEVAELAVVVDDVVQHRGIGRLMLGRLVDVAREAGLREIVADVLRDNTAMLALLDSFELPKRSVIDAYTVTVTLDLTRLVLTSGRQERAREHLRLASHTQSAS